MGAVSDDRFGTMMAARLVDVVAELKRVTWPDKLQIRSATIVETVDVGPMNEPPVAVLLVLPWLMYQLWAFVAPGLYESEKKFALPLIFLFMLTGFYGSDTIDESGGVEVSSGTDR